MELDDVTVIVPDRSALDARSTRLAEHGVEHSPTRDAGYAEFVSFCDPDGLARETWLPTAD